MSLFRADLVDLTDPTNIGIEGRKTMMCLNEGVINPYPMIDEAFNQNLQWVQLNRYFDDVHKALMEELANYVGHGVSKNNIVWGNGCDDMIYNVFLASRKTSSSFALSLAPSYFDYSTFSKAVGLGMKFLDFEEDLTFNIDKYLEILNSEDCTLGVLCNPNNPTGQLLGEESLIKIIEGTKKPILLDETYFEFSGKTLASRIKDYPNLLIVRSFSKAFSMAGVRFGYLISQPQNVLSIRKVQTTFNVSTLTKSFVYTILLNKEAFLRHTQQTIKETQDLKDKLIKLGAKAMPTHTNFVTFTFGEFSEDLYEYLLSKDIAIRNLGSHKLLENYLRVSCGSTEENALFLCNVEDFLYAQ